MPHRLQSQDCYVQIFSDGDRLAGTKCRITDWEVGPDVEVDSQRYAGEQFDRLREVYTGGSFSLTMHLMRPTASVIEQKLMERATGKGTWRLDIRVTGPFRSGEVEVCDLLDCYVEGPKRSGSGTDLVTLPLSGRCHLIDYS